LPSVSLVLRNRSDRSFLFSLNLLFLVASRSFEDDAFFLVARVNVLNERIGVEETFVGSGVESSRHGV
jgi:hypothetical protein